MATDSEIIDGILAREGGFVDDAADRGGPTNFGITQRTLSKWLGREATVDDVRNLSRDTARAIYQKFYVDTYKDVSPETRKQVVDIGVMSGEGVARRLLANALKHQRPLNTALAIERILFYAAIIEKDHSQAKFANGWMKRAVFFI